MSYLTVIVVLGLVIAIHEGGHLLAAKLCGIPIKRFSVGFGPKLVGFKWRETSYWLSMIPLGGYVLPTLDESEFRRFPLHKRILFAVGGPIANIVAAYLSLIALGRLQFGLPAFDTLLFATTQMGIGLQELTRAIVTLFAGGGELSGIVGIIATGGSEFGSTLAGLLSFSVAINMNLAIFNLLPLLPLDGGRIAFAVLEKIYRPLFRIQVPLTLVGWVFMFALMVYATVQDLGRIGVLS